MFPDGRITRDRFPAAGRTWRLAKRPGPGGSTVYLAVDDAAASQTTTPSGTPTTGGGGGGLRGPLNSMPAADVLASHDLSDGADDVAPYGGMHRASTMPSNSGRHRGGHNPLATSTPHFTHQHLHPQQQQQQDAMHSLAGWMTGHHSVQGGGGGGGTPRGGAAVFAGDLLCATESAAPMERFKAFVRLFAGLRRTREALGLAHLVMPRGAALADGPSGHCADGWASPEGQELVKHVRREARGPRGACAGRLWGMGRGTCRRSAQGVVCQVRGGVCLRAWWPLVRHEVAPALRHTGPKQLGVGALGPLYAACNRLSSSLAAQLWATGCPLASSLDARAVVRRTAGMPGPQQRHVACRQPACLRHAHAHVTRLPPALHLPASSSGSSAAQALMVGESLAKFGTADFGERANTSRAITTKASGRKLLHGAGGGVCPGGERALGGHGVAQLPRLCAAAAAARSAGLLRQQAHYVWRRHAGVARHYPAGVAPYGMSVWEATVAPAPLPALPCAPPLARMHPMCGRHPCHPSHMGTTTSCNTPPLPVPPRPAPPLQDYAKLLMLYIEGCGGLFSDGFIAQLPHWLQVKGAAAGHWVLCVCVCECLCVCGGGVRAHARAACECVRCECARVLWVGLRLHGACRSRFWRCRCDVLHSSCVRLGASLLHTIAAC